MTKFIKITIFLFCLFITTMVFGRSSEWFETTTAHMVKNSCDRNCRMEIIEKEIEYSVLLLMKSVLAELQYQLEEKTRKKIWEK